MNDTVLFVGAGFSKACGLKTTAEVADAFVSLEATTATPTDELQGHISRIISEYWCDVFGWKSGQPTPTLEDHFTMIDLTANSGHNLGRYSPRKLRAIRRLSIHRTFDILDSPIRPSSAVNDLLERVAAGKKNAVISTNWDTAIERVSTNHRRDYSYGLQTYRIQKGALVQRRGFKLLKLHGSANWTYCDTCRRIFSGRPGGGKAALHSWTFLTADDMTLFGVPPNLIAAHRDPFSCPFCGVEVSARVGTFSFRKALDFFQFQAVWDQALEALRSARRWLFIGYSLPQADFEIRRLLKTAQLADGRSGPKTILAVPGENQQAYDNYVGFFGRSAEVELSWFDPWWQSQKQID